MNCESSILVQFRKPDDYHKVNSLQNKLTFKLAKRTTNRPQKKLTFIDIIKGNFLNRDEIKIHYKYFLLLFVLMMAMIYSNHLVNKKIKIVNALKEETEEYKLTGTAHGVNVVNNSVDDQADTELLSFVHAERTCHSYVVAEDKPVFNLLVVIILLINVHELVPCSLIRAS